MSEPRGTCIRCEKEMGSFIESARGHQPSEGLAFNTTGHYGSTFFDPMDGTYLEISICDDCLAVADRRGWIFHSAKERTA